MGKGHYVQLIKKPSVAMPVIPLQPMESVYKSADNENVTPAENITFTNVGQTAPTTDRPSQKDDVPVITPDNIQYCAVHGCEVTNTKNETQSKTSTLLEQNMVNFPIAAEVCETASKSNLQEFNPLNDSEPNLEFDMMDQNNADNPDLHVKLIQEARTRKWDVKIRNLTKEQVDFIAGPRLLPTLAKTDAVVIEHHEQQPAPVDVNHYVSSSEKHNNNVKSTNPNTNKNPPNESTISAVRPK